MNVEGNCKDTRGDIVQYLPRASRLGRKRKGVTLKKLGTIITLAVFLVLIFACIRYFSLFQTLKGSDMPAIWRPGKGERTQFLIAGRLENQITSCTLLSVPAEEGAPVYILRIPPASLLDNSSQVNSLTAVFSEQGIEAGVRGIDTLLGNKLPIDHFVIYDIQGLAEIVAILENVMVELPEGFQVTHNNTDYIFSSGENIISADNLIPFIASENGFGDASFWAEKSLLVEVFNNLFSLKHISDFISNMGSIAESYETDMPPRQLAKFRDTLQALTWEERSYIILPGQWLTSQDQIYWSCDQRAIEATVSQIMDNIPGYDRAKLIVDLFNGNGVNGFAASTANSLKARNYIIGKVGNANISEQTCIYYQEEYKLAAVEIAAFLDVEAVFIQDKYMDSDNPVAVILGLDLVGR